MKKTFLIFIPLIMLALHCTCNSVGFDFDPRAGWWEGWIPVLNLSSDESIREMFLKHPGDMSGRFPEEEGYNLLEVVANRGSMRTIRIFFDILLSGKVDYDSVDALKRALRGNRVADKPYLIGRLAAGMGPENLKRILIAEREYDPAVKWIRFVKPEVLAYVAQHGDIDSVNLLIAEGAPITQKALEGALISGKNQLADKWASYLNDHGGIDKQGAFIASVTGGNKKGADDYFDVSFVTDDVVNLAAHAGNEQLFDDVIAVRPVVSDKTLQDAVIGGNRTIVAKVVDMGVPVENESLIEIATEKDNLPVTEELIMRQAPISFKAAYNAGLTGNSSLIALVGAQNGAAVNDGLLAGSVYVGNDTEVSKLLNKGVPPADNSLLIAIERGFGKVARLLKQAGAKSPPGSKLADYAFHHKKDWINAWIEGGLPLDGQDSEGDTALMQAARRGNDELVDMLIKAGASLTLRNSFGKTALDRAILDAPFPHNKARVIEVIKNALVRQGVPGELLIGAAERDRTNNVALKILIDAGANVDCQDAEGNTALMQAARNGNSGGVKMLLEAGANPLLKNKFNATAFGKARGKDHTGIMTILQEAEKAWKNK